MTIKKQYFIKSTGYFYRDLKKIVKDINSTSTSRIKILPVSQQIISLGAKHKLNLNGATHTIDNFGLKHALIKHGKSARPLTISDFKNVPLILSNYIEEIRTGRHELAFKTMYKAKTPFSAK